MGKIKNILILFFSAPVQGNKPGFPKRRSGVISGKKSWGKIWQKDKSTLNL